MPWSGRGPERRRPPAGGGAIRKRISDPRFAGIPFFLGTVAAEAYRLRGDRARNGGYRGYEAKDAAASLAMGVGSLVTGIAVGTVTNRFDAWLRRHRVIDVGTGKFAWIIAIFGWDFLYYWDHRWSHEVRLFWASHENHHSSQYYNLSTALRQPWSGFLVHWVYAPLFLLGVTPPMFTAAGGINLVYQYWIHTELIDRLPPSAELVVNTPSHHRVHHGVQPQYLDKNYGSILIVWDRLFGTFEPEREPVRYGLTKNISTFNPLRIAYHEFVAIASDVRRARTWGERWGYVFRHPGWQPSGSAG